ncbi:PPE domain-containing protein [Nocardia sp. CA2R105]|uniref:PPE domain-containing protein n=1 Tax=Nocardia coffeae TaxID=2873381 RepID=UPI001CA6D79B|nr:PPE domain-containing protein [Nocardia coffeae]MBY8862756.1 PPE domain-containing protein [Nocardia coffeae]
MLPFDFFAIAAQEIIGQLLIGPGTGSIRATAEAYAAIAAQLHAAAAGTDGSMTQMGETWRGPSSDTAQAAFRTNATTLRQQAEVAHQTSLLLNEAEFAYDVARQAMLVVQAELIEFEARQTALAIAGMSGIPTAPLLLVMETESIAILGAAVGVMVNYGAVLGPTLAAFPPPVVGQPVVNGVGGPVTPTMTSVDYLTSTGPGNFATRSLLSSTSLGSSSTSGGTVDNSSVGTQETPTGTTEATDPTNTPSSPADTAQSTTSQVDPGSAYSTDSAANGYDGGPANHSGLYGTSRSSPTLAGLNGGVGSTVALGMTRGGLGSLSGASTGYRMPANWSSGGARAFGATAADAAETPVSRPVAPRGASAPEARMRRRRDENEKSVSKVIVPGEPQDVPVLETAPTIGVIEYSDDDSGPNE